MTPPSYPFPTEFPLDPPPRLAELRRTEPISLVEFAGAPAWLLTRYDDVRAALNEPGLLGYFPGMTEGTEAEASAAEQGSFLMMMNGPPHTRLRRFVSGALGARRVAALRPSAERTAHRLVAGLRGSGAPIELIHDLAAPLAIDTLGALISVDVTAHADFARWSTDVTALFGEADQETVQQSGMELFGFIAALVDAERDGAGLIGDLFRATDADGGGLSDAEVTGLIGQLLLNGYVPTAMVFGLSALRVLTTPCLATELRADPGLLPGAVDELLRLDPAAAGNADRPFRARTDVEIGGTRIRRGEVVIAPLGAANRDPAYFTDPDRLDPARRPNPHLSFSPGVHHCLGAALARMQLEVGLAALIDGGPLEVVGEPRWHTGLIGETQLSALPVRVPAHA
ncbi:MAG: cytochrome P450 [Pseudonocardia sp.]|nr:cytochrome P450 [Pseudonocardia sp.]